MTDKWHGGKGSRPRKIEDRARYEENYHRIFGHKDKSNRCQVCSETDGRHTIKCVHYQKTAVDDAADVTSKYDTNNEEWYDGDLGSFL